MPRGDPDAFAFCIRTKKWFKLANLPVGRIYSTSFVVENRYIFLIGGFDWQPNEIYYLDVEKVISNGL